MRKLILVAVLTAAPLLTLGSTPAAAFGCGWFGYGYSSAYTPRAYSYAPIRRYYRPRAYYGRTIYRPGARVVARRAAWRGARRWR